MTVMVSIAGEPQGKARARVVRTKIGRSARLTPRKPRHTKSRFASVIKTRLAAGSFRRIARFVLKSPRFSPVPKSKSKREKEQMREGELIPIKKPDADNITKIICDALNGVAYAETTNRLLL